MKHVRRLVTRSMKHRLRSHSPGPVSVAQLGRDFRREVDHRDNLTCLSPLFIHLARPWLTGDRFAYYTGHGLASEAAWKLFRLVASVTYLRTLATLPTPIRVSSDPEAGHGLGPDIAPSFLLHICIFNQQTLECATAPGVFVLCISTLQYSLLILLTLPRLEM